LRLAFIILFDFAFMMANVFIFVVVVCCLMFRYIEVDPEVCGGKPVIKGTRVTVEVILESLANGWSVEETAREFKIPREAVLEALRYAYRIVREVSIVK